MPSKRRGRMWILAAGLVVLVGAAFWLTLTPPIGGDWADDHAELPAVRFDGQRVTIQGYRNFTYRSADEYEARYETRELDLDQLESVWYVLVPFSTDWRGPAHSFLSFGFADSTYVSVSVEARRQRGEPYSMLGGLLHRFQVIYVVGAERDLLGVRAVHREDDVYLYPIRATPEGARALFVEMLRRADQLREQPEFYNTLFNNCTTNILAHVNRVSPKRIGYGPRIMLPGYSDRVAHEHGLIDTDLSLEAARERYRVSERARAAWTDPAFSARIRETP